MRRTAKPYLKTSLILFALFIVYTAIVLFVDVRPIGPEGSSVGLATFNELFRIDYRENLLKISDLLGYAALGVVICFALVGVIQLIQRKDLLKVDYQLLLLGAFYIVVLILYFAFSKIPVNYRPVILEDGLEPSYPSSHAMLSICVLATAIPMLQYLLKRQFVLRTVLSLLSLIVMAALILCRTLSGVHWMTDIIGSLLLSAALVSLYLTLVKQFAPRKKRRPRN